MPRLSVIMSVYNGERYLQAALDSILQQTFEDFDFLIVNDASSDGTAAILKAAAQRDPRVRVFNNASNLGLTASLNQLLMIAEGEYIARMDADDLSLPQRFAKQVAYLDAHPACVLVGADMAIINAEGEQIDTMRRAEKDAVVAWRMLFYNHLAGHSQVMFRTDAALAVGGYDEARRYSQDYDLWLRLQALGTLSIMPEILLHYRRHEASITARRYDEQTAISTADAQTALNRFLNKPLSSDDVERLTAFWLQPFPRTRYARRIQRRLRRIYMGYMASLPKHAKRQIRADVGRQFATWARSVGLREMPLRKVQLFVYTARWHPWALIAELWRRGRSYAAR